MRQKLLVNWETWIVITLVTVLATMTRAATVVKVAAGQAHSVFVMSDGSLWGMGAEDLGQLGQGFGLDYTNLPVQIIGSNVTAVACGESHTMFIESDGSLWAMGANDHGELNDGTNVAHFFPEKVVGSQVTSVACGDFNTFYKTSSGGPVNTVSLLGVGDDEFGELGNGTTTPKQVTPVVIQSSASIPLIVTSFAGGYGHALYARNNGSLWAMGYNNDGQLGNGGTIDQHTAVEIESNDVVAVAAGYMHSLYLKSDGEMWGMGQNGGALGDGGGAKHFPEQIGFDVSKIAAGNNFSLYIKTDGSLWGMGENDFGELGDGATTNQLFPVQIVASNVVAIAAGSHHSLFIKTDGSLWGMGANFVGSLGNGSTNTVYAPIRIVPPAPSPVLMHVSVSGTNATLSASNGLAGATYYVLTSTNMALPVDQWANVATNQLSGDGNFTMIATNAIIPGARAQFFRIKLLD